MPILHASARSFPLRAPFRIARGVKTAADVITVTLRSGIVEGRGEGVPYPRYAETIEKSLHDVENAREAVENGASRDDLRAIMPPGAARNAIDCAMWDLEARLSRTSVAERLQTDVSPVASAVTIVIDTPDAMARAAAALSGAPLLKVKLDADRPVERLRAVRDAAPDATIIVDPNESWNEAILTAIEPDLSALNVAMIEQPVPAGQDAWLANFQSRLLLCADESVHLASDLDIVAARYGAVNIKLDKTGGLTEALHLAEQARGRGLRLMVGCMVCSSLGIAPALYLAQRADFVDLDGPYWLGEDYPGGARLTGGTLMPPHPGFWGDRG